MSKTESSKSSPTAKRNYRGVPIAQRRRARKLLIQALYQWLLSQTSVIEIEAQFRAENPGKIDWDFFHEVLSEIPTQLESIDQLLVTVIDRELKALDPIEKALLLLGTFELANRIDVPYRVVISECVELAKVFGATDGHKYVNGVLDKLSLQLRTLEISASH